MSDVTSAAPAGQRGYRCNDEGTAGAVPSRVNAGGWTYQKNCARASRMLGSSLTKPRAVELYFLLSTIT